MSINHILDCPIWDYSEVSFLITAKWNVHDKNLFDLLDLIYKLSEWWHCSCCNHVFLNPLFDQIIESRLYGNESIYRKYSIGDKSDTKYLQSIDNTIQTDIPVHLVHRQS